MTISSDHMLVMSILRASGRGDVADQAETLSCSVVRVETKRARRSAVVGEVRTDVWHVLIGSHEGADELAMSASVLRTVTTSVHDPFGASIEWTFAHGEDFLPTAEAVKWVARDVQDGEWVERVSSALPES